MTRIDAMLLCAALGAVAGSGFAEERVQAAIAGGHATDPRDRGRPVVLIAGALGVTAEVFREAFSHVTPAPAGREPEPAQVQRNKTELLRALARFGVTNELLDRVSDYYRYRPGGDRQWRATAATAYATVRDGVVTSVAITDGGSGYSSPPKVTIPGHPEVKVEAALSFGRDLEKNGAVVKMELLSQIARR